jgi:ABC-2 type transport system permease protein
MKKMTALVKRELWEQRALFLYLPVLVAALLAFFVIGSTLRMIVQDQDYFSVSMMGAAITSMARGNGEDPVEGLEGFASLSLETRETAMEMVFSTFTMPMFLTFWMTVLVYFFLTFYQQKKTRSILFWKSMPVSDTEEVLSKVAAGLCLYVGISWLCIIALTLIAMLMISVYGLFHEISIWETFWLPANLFSHAFKTFFYFVFSGLWCLPVYGWTLLVSAWAKSAPLAWLAGVPVALMALQMFYLDSSSLARLAIEHTVPIWTLQFMDDGIGVLLRSQNFSYAELVLSIVLGGLLLIATRWVWSRAEEI